MFIATGKYRKSALYQVDDLLDLLELGAEVTRRSRARWGRGGGVVPEPRVGVPGRRSLPQASAHFS
jgi:hypothetical protein